MNKFNVWIIAGSLGVVFSAGFIFARISSKPETPAVQSHEQEIDREAARLEAEAELAAEIAKRSASEAENAITISRLMWKKFDRLAVLCAYDKLYDIEKQEIKELYDQLNPYFGDIIHMSYNSDTGKVDGIVSGSVHVITTDAKKASERDKKRILELQRKAMDDAKVAAEKRLECLKYAASKK